MHSTPNQLLERAFLLAEIAQRALERASNAGSQQERRQELMAFQEACIQLVEKMNRVELTDARREVNQRVKKPELLGELPEGERVLTRR